MPAADFFWPLPAADVAGRVRESCALCASWCIGLPRRAGGRLYAMNDAEARWQRWQVTEYRGGLGRGYRDERFARAELQASLAGPDPAPPAGDR